MSCVVALGNFVIGIVILGGAVTSGGFVAVGSVAANCCGFYYWCFGSSLVLVIYFARIVRLVLVFYSDTGGFDGLRLD
ncbi:hypothetical protein C2G38_2151604 [Gigaspora rosea]|uniref:Transmembrane protein n=1 Tax=Gigaspora rosea TaxID=44941 RepID=A0A397W8Z3_9GLOM|nr:hypothetical protein C2G38_2151604 [Gigaspora rosea]